MTTSVLDANTKCYRKTFSLGFVVVYVFGVAV
jgi:hypothetical protein